MTATSEPRRRMSSRLWSAVAGVALTAVLVVSGGGLGTPPAAEALDLDLPTWQDVQNAKKSQSAADAKVTEIQSLIKQVEEQVEQTRKASEAAAAALETAEKELMDAQVRTTTLEEQAAQSEEKASAAAEQAASLVSQMYRSGGVDRNVELFLESDDEAADSLLERLALMSKATERNTKVSDEAEQAMNNADSLGKQAATARDERDRLRAEAEEKREEAANAASAAVDELAEQEEQKVVLETQLAALKDKTTDTVDGYQERLRLEEQERQRLAREAAERAREAELGVGRVNDLALQRLAQ
ncbi:MAG: coiled-coil domain-containing protein, partial [Leucobacter sp.]